MIPRTTSVTLGKDTIENVKRCKNFLQALIKTSSRGNGSIETAAYVRELVKALLEAKMKPEEFTSILYTELKYTASHSLVPLLKKSLPVLRHLTTTTAAIVQPSQLPKLASAPAFTTTIPGAVPGTVVRGGPAPRLTVPVSWPQVQAGVSKSGQTTVAGVNLSNERTAFTSGLVGVTAHSSKDEAFLFCAVLQKRMLEIGMKYDVTDLGDEVVNYVSHAAKQRLQDLMEKVSQVARQKNINFKEDDSYEQSSDVRAQLKFFRHGRRRSEKEIRLKTAKMLDQDLVQIRNRVVNMAALAAIGPRKKGVILDSSSSLHAAEGLGSGNSLCPTRRRVTRVNLRDLLFCLDNRFTRRSHFVYKAYSERIVVREELLVKSEERAAASTTERKRKRPK